MNEFIISNILAILVLYLTLKLDYDEDTATVLYHSFTTLVYFCCVIGAIISDSWWGKFKTVSTEIFYEKNVIKLIKIYFRFSFCP